MAIDGRTQSEWPAAMTMTGRTKAATSSIIVAIVTDRSILLASVPDRAGPGPRRDPDAIDQDGEDDDTEDADQDRFRCAVQIEAAPHQPEGGEGQLDETAHTPDSPGPGDRWAQLGCRLLKICHFSLPCVRNQSTVSVTAAARGVPPAPNVDSNLAVSSTNGSSNS